MKIIRKSLWVILCIIVFIIVFAISLIIKLSSITGIGANSFTLQNAAVEEARYHGEIARDTGTTEISIKKLRLIELKSKPPSEMGEEAKP